MPFKVKDLMINILPDVGGERFPCPGRTIVPCLANSVQCGCTFVSPRTCVFATTCGCSIVSPYTCLWGSCGCSVVSPYTCLWGSCGPVSGITCAGTINCGGSETPITPVIQGEGEVGPETLSALKDQLRQALGQVEAQERAMEESMRPQSVAEVEQLEQKMKAALEELKARKEELQKKSPDGQG